jgi:hypothetical protein
MRDLGVENVCGCRRVPIPATGITIFICFLLEINILLYKKIYDEKILIGKKFRKSIQIKGPGCAQN